MEMKNYSTEVAKMTMAEANERELLEMEWFEQDQVCPDLLAQQDRANNCWASILELANELVG